MGFFDGLGLLFGGLIVFAGCFALLYLPAYLVTMAFTDRCRGSSTAAKVLDALASLGAAYVLIEEDLGAALPQCSSLWGSSSGSFWRWYLSRASSGPISGCTAIPAAVKTMTLITERSASHELRGFDRNGGSVR